MSKKPMTWLELIKLKLAEEKSKGKAPSIGDVTPFAKKEWVQIKEGKHPLYIQGKAQTFARKKKGENKTKKKSKASTGSPASTGPAAMQQVLTEAKLCVKCKRKIEKIMQKKDMKGGSCASSAAQIGGNCNGSCGLSGGCTGCVM